MRDQIKERARIIVANGGWGDGRLLNFAEDVHTALNTVPSCSMCKWWHGVAEGQNESADGRKTCTEPTVPGEQRDEFMTLPDFGCVRWEPNP